MKRTVYEETVSVADGPDAPADTERELVVSENTNNEDDFERLLNMAENLPDDYEERSRPRAARSKPRVTAVTTRWRTWSPGPSRCRITWITS